MTADLDHTNPTNNIKKQHKDLLQIHKQCLGRNKERRHKQVTIDNNSSEYYSSNEQDSDSKDNLS